MASPALGTCAHALPRAFVVLFAATCHRNSEPSPSLFHVPLAPKSDCDFYLHLEYGSTRTDVGERNGPGTVPTTNDRVPLRAQVGNGIAAFKRGQLGVVFLC